MCFSKRTYGIHAAQMNTSSVLTQFCARKGVFGARKNKANFETPRVVPACSGELLMSRMRCNNVPGWTLCLTSAVGRCIRYVQMNSIAGRKTGHKHDTLSLIVLILAEYYD